MALLSEGTSVKESPQYKEACAPCVRGSMLVWGPIFSVKFGLVPGFSGGSDYSVTLGGISLAFMREDLFYTVWRQLTNNHFYDVQITMIFFVSYS